MLLYVLFILIAEFCLSFVFSFFTPKAMKSKGIDYASIGKGVAERLFLLITLVSGYPHALTVFSALKLGSRLTYNVDEKIENSYNNFFLLGNFISVIVAIGYVSLYEKLDCFVSYICNYLCR